MVPERVKITQLSFTGGPSAGVVAGGTIKLSQKLRLMGMLCTFYFIQFFMGIKHNIAGSGK